jgi:PIN domain nuclease of toxin-antitoxin system
VNVLIDTHCWLWANAAPSRLNEKARAILEDGSSSIYLSAASSWEISIKVSLGKLRLPEPPEVYVPKRMADQAIGSLPIEHVHALRVAALPQHHKDLFDRMIVAQALIEGMPILTADQQITLYDVRVIWAA